MMNLGKLIAFAALGAVAIAPVAAQTTNSVRASSAAKLSVSAAVAAATAAEETMNPALLDGAGVTVERAPWALIGLGSLTAIVLAVIIAAEPNSP